MMRLIEQLTENKVMLIDGGVGTQLELMGVPMVPGAWCGGSALTHPDELKQVHLDHIAAGAKMIIANTYASARQVLAQAGLEDQFEALNRLGVEIALAARDEANASEVIVAGSISTTDQGGQFPDSERALADFTRQREILLEAGAEMIILEMMRDIPRTLVALEAVKNSGVPVWVGMSCVVVGGVPYMVLGSDTLADTLTAIADYEIDAIAIMHTEVDDVDPCLDVLEAAWSGPIGVYAQTGNFDPPHWVFIDTISPEDYAAACQRWVERGVQIIGGCCGITTEHIALLHDQLPSHAG